MRRVILIAVLMLAMVATLCPAAVAQDGIPSPTHPAQTQMAPSTFSFSFVILVVGVLVAITLPTFVGARSRAQDKAAEASLRNGIVAAMVYFTDADTFSGFDPKVAGQIEPSLRWTAGKTPTGPNDVSIVGVTGTHMLLVSKSDSGTFFCIFTDATKGTTYGMGRTFRSVDSALECGAPSGAWP